MPEPLLKISNLSVDFINQGNPVRALDDASFIIEQGKTMALVGESGSGKSITALSIMRLLPYPQASHGEGSSIKFHGEELIHKEQSYMRSLRGRKIGMIFQEPLSALNPLHTIEKQIGEVLELHQGMNKKQALERIYELLELVGLPEFKDRLNAYPHQLSGGQRQRVMIAMALANEPELLIADEPTTALDVTIQAQILDLLQDLQKRLNMALLLITHDLSIVQKMADDVCVMKKGEIVEQKSAKSLFDNPSHEYTKMLLSARPESLDKKSTEGSKVIIKGANIKVYFPKSKNFFGKTKEWIRAVDDINIEAKQGQTIGVVGESGSGKTTLGFALLKLLKSSGNITFLDQDISAYSSKQLRPLRSDMQIVFQDPYGSLSPRMSVNQIINEGLELHKKELSAKQRDELIIEALQDVHMDPDTRHRYPHEFSGGQRQRISIARAMVLHPKFVVLDEPTSALDVSVQAQIVDLLHELQEKHTLSYIFISHDLRVIKSMAHQLIVMQNGKVVEAGSAEDIFTNPKELYTKTLLNAALNLRA